MSEEVLVQGRDPDNQLIFNNAECSSGCIHVKDSMHALAESGGVVHKFGAASVGASLIPVTQSGFYRTPTSATALELVTSGEDNATGAGARAVVVQGLDLNWEHISFTVPTTGGTTPLGTDLLRMYRWYVSESGAYADFNSTQVGSHENKMTIQTSGGGAVWSEIDIALMAKGQSEIGFYTVPLGKTAYVWSQHINVDSSKAIDLIFVQRPLANDTTTGYTGTSRIVNQFIGVTGLRNFRPKSPFGPLCRTL